MGTEITDWAKAEGAIFIGAGTSWEVIWTIVAAVLCVLALIIGSRHELDAYRRMRDGKPVNTGPG